MRHPTALLCALLVLLPVAAGAQEKLVDGIAAQVGTEIVLISEVNHAAAPILARMRKEHASAQQMANVRADALEHLIDRALLKQVVRRADLTASDAEVDTAIQNIAKQNGISVAQLKQSVLSQGMKYTDYRERIRSEIEQSKVVNGMIASRVHIDEKEIHKLYEKLFADQPKGGEEYLLRHILVPYADDSPEAKKAACSTVADALARIKAGEDFQKVARQVSQVNAQDGGTIGWVHENVLAGWMKDTVQKLPVGGVSDVMPTPFGCNILQVADKRKFQPVTYAEAHDKLRRQIWNHKMDKEYAKFIDQLRKKTYIERKGVFADAAQLDPSAIQSEENSDSGGNDPF